MEFKKMDAAQYRALDNDAFAERKAAVLAELENAESKVELADLNAEVAIIEQETERRNAAVALRNANVAAVAAGAGAKLDSTAEPKGASAQVVREEDPFDTDAYTRAFMNYLERGERMPDEVRQAVRGRRPDYVRADDFTVVNDNPNYVPTTLSNTILEKMQGYGDLYPMLSKTSVRGGVDYSVWDFEPEASWVTEDAPSEDQKVDNTDDLVSFKYHMLECKIAWSFMTGLVTMEMFRRKFPEVVAKAMVKKLEQGYIRGTGTGQMLGILNDARIPAANKIALTEANLSSYKDWHALVKAKMKKSYRDGTFIMGQGTWDTYIDGMVDSSGQPIGRTNYGINGEETYRFMGKSVKIVEDDIFADFADAKANDAFAVFTRPSDYLVNQQQGMRVVNWNDEDNNIHKHKAQTVVDGRILRPWGTLVLTKAASK